MALQQLDAGLNPLYQFGGPRGLSILDGVDVVSFVLAVPFAYRGAEP